MKQQVSTPIVILTSTIIFCVLLYLSSVNLSKYTISNLNIGVINDDQLLLESLSLVLKDDLIPLESDNKSLVFVGDIMLGRHVEYLISVNDYRYPFAESQFLNETPAHIIGNFEASVPTQHKKTPNFNYQFSVSKDNLKGLSETGFTHLSLANNHALDYAIAGYKNTKATLGELGIATFGQPKSLGEDTIIYLSASNTIYALIGLNATQMEIEEVELKPYLQEADANSQVQIVYIHWGEEYTHTPSPSQKAIAKMLAQAGVDIVIGHHPHVVQSIEIIDKTLVFYSLGNYIFDQYFTKDVMEGLALRVTRVDDKLKVTLLPHSSAESHAQPRLLTGKMKTAILKEIAEYSDENMAEMIVSGEVFTPLSLASSTEIAIMNP